VQHVLGPELVTDLIAKDTTVKIGGTLQRFEGYYAPKELQRYIWLQSNVINNSDHVFAVCGTTLEDLLNIIPSGKTVESVWAEGINLGDITQNM
jgi:hypothetical protein